MKTKLLLILMIASSMGRKILIEQVEKQKIHDISYVDSTLKTGILGYKENNDLEKYVNVNMNSKSLEIIDSVTDTVISHYLNDIVKIELEPKQQQSDEPEQNDECCIRVNEKDQKYYVLCFKDRVMMKEWLEIMQQLKGLDWTGDQVKLRRDLLQQNKEEGQQYIRFMNKRLQQVESKQSSLEQLMKSEQKEMQINDVIADQIKDRSFDQLDKDLADVLATKNQQIRFRAKAVHRSAPSINRVVQSIVDRKLNRIIQQNKLNRMAKKHHLKTIPSKKHQLRRTNRMKRMNKRKQQLKKMNKMNRLRKKGVDLQRMKRMLAKKMQKKIEGQIKKKLLTKMMINEFKKRMQKKMKKEFSSRVKKMKRRMEHQMEQNYKKKMRLKEKKEYQIEQKQKKEMRLKELKEKMEQNREIKERFNKPMSIHQNRFLKNVDVSGLDRNVMSDIDRYVRDQQEKFDKRRKGELDQEFGQYEKEYKEISKRMRFRKKMSDREKKRLGDELQKSENEIMKQMGDIVKRGRHVSMNRRRIESQNMNQNNEMMMDGYDGTRLKKYQKELEEGLQLFKKRLNNNLGRIRQRLRKH